MRADRLTMGYFDNFDDGPLNKYKKILKMEKNLYMRFFTYGWMIIQISYNFIII
jgi:hypothetical protein